MRDYLKRLRINCRFTQDNVAKRIGVTSQYYNMIENGSRQKSMDLKIISGLANVFNVPIDYIIQQEQQMKRGE